VSEDDNVLIRGVQGDTNAIGFFGCAYFFENKDKLKDVAVVSPKTQKEVHPTPETIKSGEYAPFSRPLFVYVNAKSLSKPEVAGFVQYFLENASDVANEVGYVGLPNEVMSVVKRNYKDRKLGTQFTTAEGKSAEGALADIYK
jgi:phosphate transport system substrate-binding protein